MIAAGTRRTSTTRQTGPVDGDVDWEQVPGSVRAAVDRGLRRAQRDALDEVEQILDAALRVVERVAPAEPRVADIVAEAGTSNQTFYRYFAGKNDLLHAVMERGALRVCSYLRHQMDKHTAPESQVGAWVEGLLAQLVRPDIARPSMALSRLTLPAGIGQPDRAKVDDLLGDLLVEPFAAAGRPRPDLDARAVQHTVVGAMTRHIGAGTVPDEVEVRHLVDFCTAAVAGRPTATGDE